MALWIPRAARADEAPSGAAPAAGAAAPSAAAGPATATGAPTYRIQWVYPKFRTWEWVASVSFSLGALAVQFGKTTIPDNNWTNGFLFDNGLRSALVASSSSGRQRARDISDITWPITQYYAIVDSVVTPLLTDHVNIEAATQMTLLNWQAQSLAFLITRSGHRFAGRTRPLAKACVDDPNYDLLCNPAARGRYASFLSGHTSMAFAGAALACAHHTALPMYGSRVADLSTCALLLAGATATGVLRIVGDRHWTTDVVAGAVVGLSTGWLMPWALHYARWNGPFMSVGGGKVGVLPVPMGEGMGLNALGLF